MQKFREVTLLGPQVIGALTPNFEPILEFSLLKIDGGPRFPVRCALVNVPWLLFSTGKHLRRQHPLGAKIKKTLKKFILGGFKLTFPP